MCPRPFPWLTITGRCWPGAYRLPSQIASGRRGIGMRKIWKKVTLRPNLCYSATSEKNWLREEDRLGDFTRRERSPKPFFERCGQDCGIISDERDVKFRQVNWQIYWHTLCQGDLERPRIISGDPPTREESHNELPGDRMQIQFLG